MSRYNRECAGIQDVFRGFSRDVLGYSGVTGERLEPWFSDYCAVFSMVGVNETFHRAFAHVKIRHHQPLTIESIARVVNRTTTLSNHTAALQTPHYGCGSRTCQDRDVSL